MDGCEKKNRGRCHGNGIITVQPFILKCTKYALCVCSSYNLIDVLTLTIRI